MDAFRDTVKDLFDYLDAHFQGETYEEHQKCKYKTMHEEFVSHQSGTTVLEIALVTFMLPLCVLGRNLFSSWLFENSNRTSLLCYFWLDFVCIVMPCLLICTLWSDSVVTCLVITSISLVWLTFFNDHFTRALNSKPEWLWQRNISWTAISEKPVDGKRPFITNYRAGALLATAICILAVDFKVFPRKFAKVETYGSGLMDVGVGGFIISNAIVSPEARKKAKSGIFLEIAKSIKSCIPLIILGVARTVAVKTSDYHEHVTEYGVHWNFFLTLAVIKILSTFLLCIVPPSFSWLLSSLVAFGYQTALSEGFSEYIIQDGNRDGFINANREGIFSCFGYLSIYFAGIQIGRFIFKPRNNLSMWMYGLLVLSSLDACAWVGLKYSEKRIEPISRRTGNLSFVLWVIAHNLFLILSFLLMDIIYIAIQEAGFLDFTKSKKEEQFTEKEIEETHLTELGRETVTTKVKTPIKQSEKEQETSCVLEAVNKNGLFFFLLCNVLTGAVNFSMKTIFASKAVAMLVLSGYLLTVCGVTTYLHAKKMYLKIW